MTTTTITADPLGRTARRPNGRPNGRPRTDRSDPAPAFAGRQLKDRRLQLGLSQEKLGHRLGVSFQQIQKYENGSNQLRVSLLAELCKALDVPVSHFFQQPEEEPAASPAAPSGTDARDGEILELVRAYRRIGDGPQRRAVRNLVRAMAGPVSE